MPISFQCPHCGARTDVAEQYAGQSGPCASCGKIVTISQAAGRPHPKSSAGPILIIVAVVAGVVILGCGGLMAALLFPAVQSAREAARRSQCANNLRQIGLAMHMYHDMNGSFPPAFVADENGNPMHSWRVLLLPYLEQRELYEQYDFEQPWNSPHNLQVAQRMPAVYGCPSGAGHEAQQTSYMAIVGAGTVFDGDKPTNLQDIMDGLSNTILVVEAAGASVGWTEPVDLQADQMRFAINAGPREIGSRHPGGANVVFADGATRFLPNGTAPQTLQAMSTKAGGEAVWLDGL